jgi:hypothetical protein
MQTIYKYKIEPGINEIELPILSRVLSVQTINDEPYIWVLQETEYSKELRKFVSIGTGWDIKYQLKEYIGTFQIKSLDLVFHLWELSK